MKQIESILILLQNVRRIHILTESATDIQMLPIVPRKWYHFFTPQKYWKSISGKDLSYNGDLYYLREYGEGDRYRIDAETGIVYKLPRLVYELGDYDTETHWFKTDDELWAFCDKLTEKAKNANMVTIQLFYTDEHNG